jgi:hypothetical protein
MLAHRYFAAVKDGQVLATTASATRQYRYALLYGRTVARWGSTRAVCEQQLDTFKPLNGEGRQLTVEIVDVVETQARLAVGTGWPPATPRTVEPADGRGRGSGRPGPSPRGVMSAE